MSTTCTQNQQQQQRPFLFGDLVKLHSLQGLKMLNGSIGTVIGDAPKDQNPDGDRIEVHLKNQDDTKNVRKTNLTHVFDTYRVSESAKAEGKGMFALRDIDVGEVILKEKSLIKIPEEKYVVEDPNKPVFKEAAEFIKKEGSGSDHELFNKLVGSNDSEKILRNVFEPQAGILFVTAMINHSCAGNTNYEFDEDENCEIVYAIRPIKQGEEIFHSYVNLSDFPTRQERQLELFIQKKFKCGCDLCTHKDTDDIDTKLKELKFMYETLTSLMKQNSYQKQVDVTAERMIELAKELSEAPFNMTPMKLLITVFCDYALRIAVRFQQVEEIGKWARKWVESFPGTHPPTKYWNNKMKEMLSYVKNPEGALKKKR